MKTLPLLASALLATVIALPALAGASPPEASTSAPDSQWTTLDADSNSSLSKSEASNDPEMNAIFDAADSNQDGQLTREEYLANQAAQPKPTDTAATPPATTENSEY